MAQETLPMACLPQVLRLSDAQGSSPEPNRKPGRGVNLFEPVPTDVPAYVKPQLYI
jgi:hypothetical protein